MSARIQVVAGPRDLTAAYSDLSFSNVDPGGFEALQVTASDVRGVEVGDEVVVRSGLDVAWHGRVNEIGSRERDGRATVQIAAVGYGSELSDKRIAEIYCDRDQSHWGEVRRVRQIALAAAATGYYAPSVVPDATTSAPTVKTLLTGPWAANADSSAWYDTGSIARVGAVWYTWTLGASVASGDAQWAWFVGTPVGEDLSGGEVSGNLRAAGPGSSYFTPAASNTYRYAYVRQTYGLAVTTLDGVDEPIFWQLAVYGSHGLTRRGTDPGGFYPGDIAGHAHASSGAGFEQVFGDSSTLTVRHAVYREPVRHEQVIADMAKLMGWHYGVWEPSSILGTTPRLFFTAPPAAPTCVIDRSQIADLDAPRVRVDRLYDTAKVAYQDPGGTSGVQTVTIVNPLTASAGVSGRTLDIDMGQGDSTTATTYGTFALNLALAGARGGGSGTVPDTIASTSGGRRPACLLRSGRDRIRITDLPDSGSWTETDANRQDSFLVRRVETTVKGGQPSTRIEFDGGADLLDVLNARLALAQATGSAV